MSDVGDAIELTFSTASGATVTATVTDPAGATTDPEAVSEDGSTGTYPFAFTPDAAGMWLVTFRSTGAAVATQQRWVRVRALATVPPLAVVEDVESRWRALTAAESDLVGALLDDASAIVRQQVTDIDARLAAGTLPPDLAAQVAARMVIRVMQMPQGTGIRQESQTIGPMSKSTTYDPDIAARHLYLDGADLALLTAAPTAAARNRSRSIRLYPGLGYRC